MWELLTRGEEPFADKVNIMEVALGIINEGLRCLPLPPPLLCVCKSREERDQFPHGRRWFRPTIPKGTPPEYHDLMVCCWAKNADDRPDFVQIHRRLKAYYDTL